jgi:hypothetical protein
MMRDDMALPAVQRDALVDAMREAFRRAKDHVEYFGASEESAISPLEAALAAIEEQYVLIPKDQVSEETEARLMGEDDGDLVPDVSCYGTLERCRREMDDNRDESPAYDRVWIESRTKMTTPWREHDDPTR